MADVCRHTVGPADNAVKHLRVCVAHVDVVGVVRLVCGSRWLCRVKVAVVCHCHPMKQWVWTLAAFHPVELALSIASSRRRRVPGRFVENAQHILSQSLPSHYSAHTASASAVLLAALVPRVKSIETVHIQCSRSHEFSRSLQSSRVVATNANAIDRLRSTHNISVETNKRRFHHGARPRRYRDSGRRDLPNRSHKQSSHTRRPSTIDLGRHERARNMGLISRRGRLRRCRRR